MATDCIHWLTQRTDDRLSGHVLLGDQVRLRIGSRSAWFAPLYTGAVVGSPRVLMLRYGEGNDIVSFCMPAAEGMNIDDVRRVRTLVSVEHARRVWGPFLQSLGFPLSNAPNPPAWRETEAPWAGAMVQVRYATHPNTLIDRLLQREREQALRDFAFRTQARVPLAS